MSHHAYTELSVFGDSVEYTCLDVPASEDMNAHTVISMWALRGGRAVVTVKLFLPYGTRL